MGDFHSKPLRPAQLETVFQDGTISVRRILSPTSSVDDDPEIDMVSVLGPLRGLYADAIERTKLKIVRITVQPTSFETTVLVTLCGRTAPSLA